MISSRLLTHRLLLALALIGLVACDTAVETPTSPSTVEPTARPSINVMDGGIDGVVRDPDGNPIEGALVLIVTREFEGTARTTAEGTFTTRGVSGEFTINVSSLEWVGQTQTVTVEPGELVTVEFTLQPLN